MRFCNHILLVFVLFGGVLACKDRGDNEPNGTDVSAWKGVVINEIAAHDQDRSAESWVEILNTTASTVDISELGLYVTDNYFTNQRIWTPAAGTKLGAGERLVISTNDESLVTGVSSAYQFVLKLAVSDGTAVDSFDRDAAFDPPISAYPRGSYQRMPDGSESWRSLTYSSKGTENKIWSYTEFKNNAVWAWSSHVSAMMADDAAMLMRMKTLGYDHILLNFAAFESANQRTTLPFLDKCEELGINVHAWMQCFYKGGWINPVDDENKCYKEDVFADIREHARTYVENFGIKGLHLDYIRFGGTASKHNVSAEVSGVGAVNRCCREIREITDSYDEGLITSAALMPEPNTEYAYGQSPSQMGKYIHVLMPMLYRYTYRWNDARCKSLTDWFANNAGDAQVWAGITTYTGNDSSGVKGMDAEEIRNDIDIFMDSNAKGLVLFRFGLGTFPDVNDLNNN